MSLPVKSSLSNKWPSISNKCPPLSNNCPLVKEKNSFWNGIMTLGTFICKRVTYLCPFLTVCTALSPEMNKNVKRFGAIFQRTHTAYKNPPTPQPIGCLNYTHVYSTSEQITIGPQKTHFRVNDYNFRIHLWTQCRLHFKMKVISTRFYLMHPKHVLLFWSSAEII